MSARREWRARAATARAALLLLAALCVCAKGRVALAFGEEGAFHPRALITGSGRWEGVRTTALARWSFELVRRTRAPARLRPRVVRADDPELLAEPFAYWGGAGAIEPLTAGELYGLRRFMALGGVLLVDDHAPETGEFGRDARRELGRVVPDAAPIELGPENVVFRTYYRLWRATGRVEGPPKLEALLRGGIAQVIFSSHDLAGALARSPHGDHPVAVTPGGDAQRERAIRLAVNVAMYALCSNYKDDLVHAKVLMRRPGPADAP